MSTPPSLQTSPKSSCTYTSIAMLWTRSLLLETQKRREYLLLFGFFALLYLFFTLHRTATAVQQHSPNAGTTRAYRASPARRRSLEPILNTTLGFERILAINLPERTDHRDGLVLASAVSNIYVDFVNGVHGESVSSKALPPHRAAIASAPRVGSWRAHMNAIARVVENGWSTSLIIEDDVDWDIRLKKLLQDFALASHIVLGSPPSPKQVNLASVPLDNTPKTSPFGDGWDVLWLGHCGMDIPEETTKLVRLDDPSVPKHHHLKSWDAEAKSPLEAYPQHTRVVMDQKESVCSLAYAISQSAARSLLQDLGLSRFDNPFDVMLRQWCEGTEGRPKRRCIGVLPQLFDHHRPIGPSAIDSDIAPAHNTYRDKAFTLNIRWSVRMNMEKLLQGNTDFDDQWPDSRDQ